MSLARVPALRARGAVEFDNLSPSAMPERRSTSTSLARPDDRACWEAVLARDARLDGRFLFGVLTTGVYCRPSCAARRPLRRNVRFYADAEQAERDGLRACRRCRPNDPTPAERMQALCESIRARADSGEPLTLAVLAAEAGMSPGHFQRTFRAAIGVSPREFVESCRLEALRHGLRRGESVTAAIYDAGFGSSSRVYERADRRLGMTPKEYRAGGKDLEISYAAFSTPVGRLLLGATDRGLCFVQFGERDAALVDLLRREFPQATLTPMKRAANPEFRRWVEALRAHLASGEPLPELPLAVRASAFRLKVWRYLQSIPPGATRTYTEVARGIGRRSAVRAVAGACAANPVAVVVPCHRVIRADGELGGYRWGLDRKRKLLARERRSAPGGSRAQSPR